MSALASACSIFYEIIMDESGMISSDIVILVPTTMPLLQKKHDNTSLGGSGGLLEPPS